VRVAQADPLIFDEIYGINLIATTMMLTHDPLIMGDWAKGPSGTGEASFMYLTMPPSNAQAGGLAESWEIPEMGTLIYHIRKGVHWHNKPPVNGRELTADDVAYSLNRCYESGTALLGAGYKGVIESITATDKWTVVIKCEPGRTESVHEVCTAISFTIPHEVVEEYGNMNDWRNACGTGPFLLIDYIRASSATFERNPNYWMKAPFFPENQLPYLDGVKYLIIPDLSTRLAALRTAKIDWLGGLFLAVLWEDAKTLWETSPELNYIGYLPGYPLTLHVRNDKPELPFYDKRVRRALAMAIDNQEIRDEYYEGKGEILVWPIMPTPEFEDMYVPLDEFPESTRELYEYHPDKARQLLAEAGYPDGFKTEIMCTAPYVDFLSIIKAYWADIGVELEIDVRETGAFVSISQRKTYTQMFVDSVSACNPWKFDRTTSEKPMYNYSMVKDPKVDEAFLAVTGAYLDEPNRRRLMKEIVPYLLEQCFFIVPPSPYVYTFWQPWLKGYNGELQVGFCSSYADFPRYVWLDQDLREEMTGRR